MKTNKNSEYFEFTKYGDGEQTRDFVYVQDVIQALLLVSEKEKAIGEVYNIGTGAKTSLNQLLVLSQSLSQKKLCIQTKLARKGDIMNSLANITKIKELGYQPLYSIDKGIVCYWKRTIERR